MRRTGVWSSRGNIPRGNAGGRLGFGSCVGRWPLEGIRDKSSMVCGELSTSSDGGGTKTLCRTEEVICWEGDEKRWSMGQVSLSVPRHGGVGMAKVGVAPRMEGGVMSERFKSCCWLRAL